MGKVLSNRIDIRTGPFTYGQRIALGQLFEQHQEDPDEVEIFKGVFRILHETEVDIAGNLQIKEYIVYLQDIIAGLLYWIEREKQLKYDPSPEERAAGVEQLSRNVGAFATIKALSQSYGVDPDTILSWEYRKVYRLLYTDSEEAKYRKRLEAVRESKRKQSNAGRRR